MYKRETTFFYGVMVLQKEKISAHKCKGKSSSAIDSSDSDDDPPTKIEMIKSSAVLKS